MTTDQDSPDHLRATEGATVAEMAVMMLQILARDAEQLAQDAFAHAFLSAAGPDFSRALRVSDQANSLHTKIVLMFAKLQPLLDDVVGRDAVASKERTGATLN